MNTIIPEPFDPELLTRERWVGIVLLSPEGARSLIGMNTNNRKIKAGRIEQYAAAILEGRWQLTPDFVALEDHVLVNGQHRCRAIADAGQAVPVGLMVNCGTAFDVVDNGASRTASDVLFLARLTDNPGALARATKLYLGECGVTASSLADNRYIERWVVDHAELDTWVAWAEERRSATRTEAASVLTVPAAVLGYAVEGVAAMLGDASEEENNSTRVELISSDYPNLRGARGPTGTRAMKRIPTIEVTREYLHRLITRTGIEEGSVEQVVVNDLDRWLARSATDRRVSKPVLPDTLRLITWGLDQVTRGLSPRKAQIAVGGPWLWTKQTP